MAATNKPDEHISIWVLAVWFIIMFCLELVCVYILDVNQRAQFLSNLQITSLQADLMASLAKQLQFERKQSALQADISLKENESIAHMTVQHGCTPLTFSFLHLLTLL